MTENHTGGSTANSPETSIRGGTTTLEETLRPKRLRQGRRPYGRQDDSMLRVRAPSPRTVLVLERLHRRGLTYAQALDRMAASYLEHDPKLADLRQMLAGMGVRS